jgi:hypothetical protein
LVGYNGLERFPILTAIRDERDEIGGDLVTR